MVGESLRYVAKKNGQWIALLGWCSAAFHLSPRDGWIGWTDAQRNAGRHLIPCNARFALLTPKSQSPNLASHLLSLNLHRLSDDWQQHYHHHRRGFGYRLQGAGYDLLAFGRFLDRTAPGQPLSTKPALQWLKKNQHGQPV